MIQEEATALSSGDDTVGAVPNPNPNPNSNPNPNPNPDPHPDPSPSPSPSPNPSLSPNPNPTPNYNPNPNPNPSPSPNPNPNPNQDAIYTCFHYEGPLFNEKQGVPRPKRECSGPYSVFELGVKHAAGL